MMIRIALSVLLAVALAACSSSEEPAPKKGPVPVARPAAAVPSGKGGDPSTALTASRTAYENAAKACQGCPEGSVCREAIKAAMVSAARGTEALINAPIGDDSLERRTTQANELAERYDALNSLAEKCDAG